MFPKVSTWDDVVMLNHCLPSNNKEIKEQRKQQGQQKRSYKHGKSAPNCNQHTMPLQLK